MSNMRPSGCAAVAFQSLWVRLFEAHASGRSRSPDEPNRQWSADSSPCVARLVIGPPASIHPGGDRRDSICLSHSILEFSWRLLPTGVILVALLGTEYVGAINLRPEPSDGAYGLIEP